MRQALSLAERGRGSTWPNPVVGAVIVKGGRVLARGFHRHAGGPHGEIDALARVGHRAPGATLYVTLEPCCHAGRTGPCTAPIIRAGIARVVVGCRDLNPLVSGGGIARLRRAGVRVDVGCLEDEASAQNRGFFSWIRDGRPWVTLKVAATLDGFIAESPPTTPGRIRWITGDRARRVAHELRARHDALLVGAQTIIADDPRLTVRLPGRRAMRTAPLRVVLDGLLRTPPDARLLSARGRPSPLVVGARPDRGPLRALQARRAAALQRAGADVLLLPGDREGRLPIHEVLAALGARGIQSVLVEGGSHVLGAFIGAGLVDQVAWFVAPRLAGAGVPAVSGVPHPWTETLALGPLSARSLDGDILLTADVIRPAHVGHGRHSRRRSSL